MKHAHGVVFFVLFWFCFFLVVFFCFLSFQWLFYIVSIIDDSLPQGRSSNPETYGEIQLVTNHNKLQQSKPLQWRHNGHDGVLNHQPQHCLRNRLFRRRSKNTANLHVTGRCAGNSPVTAGNSPVTGELPAQMASKAENISIWWRHHAEYIFNEMDSSMQVTSLWGNSQIQSNITALKGTLGPVSLTFFCP